MLAIKLDQSGKSRNQSLLFSLETSSQMALPWMALHLWLSSAAHRGGQPWEPPQGTMLTTFVPRPIIKSLFVRRELPEGIFLLHMAAFMIFGILQGNGLKRSRVWHYCNYYYYLSDCPQCGRPRFDSWAGKIPWRRKWQPTPVPLPGKPHEQRSLVGYSPWGRKEWDTTERLHFTLSILGMLSRKYHELGTTNKVTDKVALITESDFLNVLEVRSSRSRCLQCLFSLKALSLVRR